MGTEDVLSCEESFRYQMLDRHKMDCNYFLGWGNRQLSRLWAGNVIDHIQNMKDLYNSFPYDKKPEWLTYEQILQYEKEMSYDEIFELEKKIKEIVEDIPRFPAKGKYIYPTIIGAMGGSISTRTVFSINLFGEIGLTQENEWIKFWTDFPEKFVEKFSQFEISSKFKYIIIAPMSIDVV